jgi:hypothetical protein
VFVDRQRFAEPLARAWALNEHPAMYDIAYGDKDLFAFGFLLSGRIREYRQNGAYPFSLRNHNGDHEAIGQRSHSDDSRVAFVHRTHQKRNCVSRTDPCVLEPRAYALVMEESDGGHIGQPSAGMRRNAARLPPEVRDALLFVAGAERRAADALGQ